MKITYADVKKSMPKEKAEKDAVWVKIWVRPLSYPLSYFALKMGLTPNSISVMAILDALISCILMSVGDDILAVIGLVLINLFILFDCMDGTMARTLKSNSYMGEFYDALGGYTMCAFSLLAAGICAYQTGRTFFFVKDAQYLIAIGAMGGITDIFSRLIYQKYTANMMITNSRMGKPITRENDMFYTEKGSFSLTYVRLEIDRQFGTGGLFPPFLLLAYFVKALDIVVILYSLYHTVAIIAVMYMYCRKASAFATANRD